MRSNNDPGSYLLSAELGAMYPRVPAPATRASGCHLYSRLRSLRRTNEQSLSACLKGVMNAGRV